MEMRAPEHFDAVIVGSGFGGSVIAHRLAEVGMRVCVLERGKAYKPGEFPRTPRQMRSNIWDPSNGYYGLFNIWSFRKIDAVVASGLGGGSLIYANVLLRKDKHWFACEDPKGEQSEYWPLTRTDLDPHYDRVERMLRPRPFPYQVAGYDTLPKVNLFRRAAQHVATAHREAQWKPLPLGVTFRNDHELPQPGIPLREAQPNIHGVTRYTCSMCGECDLGCNHGSKNTMDYTFLSAAVRNGAQVRTLCEVRDFAPRDGGGYEVRYVQHTPDTHRQGVAIDSYDEDQRPLTRVTADRLILAAGTLGTTFLLLRCRDAFPKLSARLGTRFCGNGDLITFAQQCQDRSTTPPQPLFVDGGRGPVITSALRVSDRLDDEQERGFYIQDAAYPHFAAWMMQMVSWPATLFRARGRIMRLLWARLRGDSLGNISNDIMEILLGQAEASATMMPLLGMGRDIPEGRMRLRYSRHPKTRKRRALLQVDWQPHYSGQYFKRVRHYMRLIANELGTDKLFDPLRIFGRTITVHPLGGCPMGRNAQEGVVDSYGKVFHTQGGYYQGLYIADGSILPGPAGVNPALTIAALADRCADGIVKEYQEQNVPYAYTTAH